MSYSATSAVLSDKVRFRTFYRTVPPDSFQARAIVDICRLAGYKQVTVIHTNDNYGSSLNTIFQALAKQGNDTIDIRRPLVVQTTGNATSISDALKIEMDKIDPKLDKVFVIFALAADAARVLEIAQARGLLNGQHAFIGVDGVMQPSLLLALQGSMTNMETWKARHLAAAGIIGTQPSSGNSSEFQSFLKLWQSKNASEYHGSGPGTSPNLFAPFAYDCVLAYAHAIAAVLRQNDGREEFLNAANVTEALKTTRVTGVTGLLTFDNNNDRDGSTYDIRNFQLQPDGSTTLVTVGSWKPTTGPQYTAPLQYAVDVLNKEVTTDPALVRRIQCDANEVSADGACKTCGANEIFVRGSESDAVASCQVCGDNYAPSDDKTVCVLNGGLIALIAIVIVVVFIAAVAALALVLTRAKKRRGEAERLALETPAQVWELADELAEVQGPSAPTPSSAGVMTTLENGAPVSVLMKTGEVPMFGIPKGSRMPVMEQRTDEIVITNRGGQDISYTVAVPNGAGAYEIAVRPGVGVVKKQSSRSLTIVFTLQQTMKVDRHIRVAIENHGAVYFPLRFEGELSQRLDPDEIELFGKPIGDGAFGTVYRGRYRGTAVAVKVLRRQNELAAEQNNNFLKEIALFQKLRNPFIVSFIGASYIPGKLCICTELLERGTVLELIQKARISLALKYKLMIDTASAVEFLHSNGVLYRDLKPDNLLVFSVSHNASVNCVRARDHQILTNRGFLFLDEVEALVDADAATGAVRDWRGLLVANYDAAAQQLVYEQPRALVRQRAQAELLELSHAQLSLAVTDNHDMYASLGAKPYAKLSARELADAAPRHAVRMLVAAKNGARVASGGAADESESSAALHQLCGFWLVDESLTCSAPQSAFVAARLAQLGWSAARSDELTGAVRFALAREHVAQLRAAAAALRQQQLTAAACRNVLAGVHASAASAASAVAVESAAVRDDVVLCAAHAGWSAQFARNACGGWTVAWREASEVMARAGELKVSSGGSDERTWCFDMRDGFIVTRRVTLDSAGGVAAAGAFSVQGNCKLSDFGTSRIVEDPRLLMNHTSGIGTPIYMAPEMMDATQKYNHKVDVYSFGMLCWELMAEKQPFNEVKRIWDLPRIVVDGLRPTIDESWPRPMQRLITEAWMHTAERRPTMKEALAVLQDLFENERRTYEKNKRNRKDDDDPSDSHGRTAHTGNLEELIQQGQALPIDTSVYLAPEHNSNNNDADGDGDGKKAKKKVKPKN